MTPSAARSSSPCGPPGAYAEVAWQLCVPVADVHVVGYGNRMPNDFTLEMLAVLKRCRRVFGVPPIHAPQLGLAPMESLMALYRVGRPRCDVYDEMAQIVLAAAAREAPVAFATYGSAMVGMPVCHQLLERAPRRGLSVHVTGAPSALDGIWAQLGIDPLAGAEIWDATTFMQTAAEPNTCANLLLAQVALLESCDVGEPVAALRERLLRSYDADHVVHFVTAPGAAAYAPRADLETLRLGELVRPGRQRLSTLLVPGSKRPSAPCARAAASAAGSGERHDHAKRRTR
ncbi:MAG: SAM-dependent methyltransferase [Solirubrobacteraceae bacterium]